MIQFDIPGFKKMELEHLVLDYNGTLACDGVPLVGVQTVLSEIAKTLDVHVVTADTFGTVSRRLTDVPCEISVLPMKAQEKAKFDYVHRLGARRTCSIGNGRNDRLMLKESSLGICVMLEEGASVEAILNADVVCRDIFEALDLLRNPLRVTATLRS